MQEKSVSGKRGDVMDWVQYSFPITLQFLGVGLEESGQKAEAEHGKQVEQYCFKIFASHYLNSL